ncbi:glycosyltransferase [Geobacter sp. FeAm09]|uniref:glycosyltransferase n=1 Tax=Geobacter sp. FeAm09 TaxID=2597769 RepID=UPI0011F0601A|nr:glycosyltransferase [Geobacter sp. FeAm09]QEM68869.1 glycosyltransferase [Geobacter sp. FeAm09]
MGLMRKTRIIVPCYNEAARLAPKAFQEALDDNGDLSFLFVDDGSTDGTLPLLTSLKERNPARVEVVSLEKNSGKAEAVRQGMLASLRGAFDYVGYWDADLATPLDVIGDFCRLLDSTGAEIAIGSRVRLLGRRIERNAWRHYCGRLFATCASLLLDIGVYDTQCGAKMFRSSAAVRRVFGTPFKVAWTFDVEMFARFPIVMGVSPAEASSRWVEFPLVQWMDVKGSKLTWRDYLRGGLEFCTLFYYLRTPAHRAYERYLGIPERG